MSEVLRQAWNQARRRSAPGWARLAVRSAAFLLMALAALLVAVAVTPPVTVTVFGQEVQVGAVAPSRSLGWSGPGQADLFGEGPVAAVQHFAGPIRPRIVWQQFSRDAGASAFIQTTTADGHRTISANTTAIGAELARGWISFFIRLLAASAVLGALVYLVALAVVGIVRGARVTVRPAPHRVWPVMLTALLAMGLTGVSAALTIVSARNQLSGVSTLADLTGTAPIVPAPPAVGPARSDVEVAVIGDSTAAGVGNAPLEGATNMDVSCGRSRDAYAEVLQAATGWAVENLACASATIPAGLLGPQPREPIAAPPQVGVLKSLSELRVVVVSIGANDIGWSDFLKYCYGLARCDDRATEKLMTRRLDTFRLQYAQLLQQLSDLPTRPEIMVTGYYDPFGDTFDCPALRDPQAPLQRLDGYGFAADPGQDNQPAKVRTKIEPLRAALSHLNSVLEQGANAFGFTYVEPTFTSHALCSDQPWVQGLSDQYPFHPKAAGELAIAAAQLPELIKLMPN